MTNHAVMHLRRGSALTIVVWAIAVAAIVTSSVQLFAYRQAHIGREAVNRVQARWAARGGVEYAIAVMADHTREPYPDDAFAMVRDLEYVAAGETLNARWDIRHHIERWEIEFAGPMDEHSKINVNGVGNSGPDSMVLRAVMENVTDDVIDEILDWYDTDDDPRPLGAEQAYYMSLPSPYEPRNGRFRSVAELELVAGVWPTYLRGEDWNLNSRLDANEDDANVSLPEDDADGMLLGAWAERLTAASREGGATHSGEERLYLPLTLREEVMERLSFSEDKARQLLRFAREQTNSLEGLIGQALLTAAQAQAQAQVGLETGGDASTPYFTKEELRLIYSETTMHNPVDRPPGKLNINTVSEFLLRELLGDNQALVDEILLLRDREGGITSIIDLASIPDLDQSMLEALAGIMGTQSNVYTISSKGRSLSSGLEVEIIAVVDRSTLPVRIIEYREQ